ncbi:MAG: hypothetical protein QMD04_01775 [Anaerolineales bacterium]|nr:hypothetical protein [Anaerolineales bacterium]
MRKFDRFLPTFGTVSTEMKHTQIKLLLGCSEEETQIALACSNNDKMRALLIPRPKEKT